MNNDKFRKSFSRRVERTKEKMEIFVIKYLVDLNGRIILKTPVDKGQLHWNWFIGNMMINYTIEDHDGTDKGGALARNKAALEAIKVNGQMIYITNSLPYAYRVEYEGWSKVKAPAGMMRLSIEEMKSAASKIALEVRALR